ncbi:hypothetical protein D9615_008223 [Tricholomella constricta]|uniref:NAD(P)-binding protein n=1 Tax=Tricholomella constricta TaxID=117010 RepID=A0A8H5H365_9AGAR|nr:hypothetical protein D9615_008223 [Tricholomella constricta]
MSLLVLSRSDVEHVLSKLTPAELQDLMARVFQLISSPCQSPPIIVTPHRTSITMGNHTALFMPARVSNPALHGTTLKAVCVPRDSADTRGLPASTIVIDEATGAVKAIVNARSLTAIRNAAGSLLSTRLVGLHTPTSIVTFGAGKQIEAHLDLHLRSFPSITSCTLVNRTHNSRVQGLHDRLTSLFPHVSFTIIPRCPPSDINLRTALRAASLIVCATSATFPLFPSSWVPTGAHVILIGSYTPAMREVDRDLVRRAIPNSLSSNNSVRIAAGVRQVLLVDSREACAIEAGELIDAGVAPPEIVEIGELVELGPTREVVLKTLPMSGIMPDADNSEGEGPITMFKSVGVGLQDVAIACAVVAKAETMGVGTTVPGYDVGI